MDTAGAPAAVEEGLKVARGLGPLQAGEPERSPCGVAAPGDTVVRVDERLVRGAHRYDREAAALVSRAHPTQLA